MAHTQINGKFYVDTAFLNSIRGIPGASVEHMGFGEFYAETPEGRVEFDRMRGVDFPDQVGRSHQVYDKKGGTKATEWLLDQMESKGKSVRIAKSSTRSVSASDRSSLIRLAASLPKGDTSRRAILAGLKISSTGQECQFYLAKDDNYYMGLSDYPPEDDDEREHWDGEIKEWYGPFPSFEIAYKYLRDNFANPGGYTADLSMHRPPPRNPIRPRGNSFRGMSASDIKESLDQFNRQWPFHRDLDSIESAVGRRTLIGNGRFDIPGQRAGLLSRAGLVEIKEGNFGKELHLTSKGKRSLAESREAFSNL